MIQAEIYPSLGNIDMTEVTFLLFINEQQIMHLENHYVGFNQRNAPFWPLPILACIKMYGGHQIPKVPSTYISASVLFPMLNNKQGPSFRLTLGSQTFCGRGF